MATKKSAATKTVAAPQPEAVDSVPSSKVQAAVQAHLYLATDDAWSRRYWNDNDLHAVERKLFG